MVQLTILSGESAGTVMVARRFPFAIGRGADNHFRIDAPGVWEKHLALTLDPAEGVQALRQGDGLAAVAGESFRQRTLRDGDVLEIGAIKIQFSLSQTIQYSFRIREWLTWLALGGLIGSQCLLIWWLRDSL